MMPSQRCRRRSKLFLSDTTATKVFTDQGMRWKTFGDGVGMFASYRGTDGGLNIVPD